MPPTPEVKEEIKDISAGTMDAQQGEAATGGQRQVEKIVRNDAAGGIAGAATFLDMGCMFKTLIRMSMATMFATEIESPAALPSSVEAAVSSMAWELDEETGLLRSRVLASILMGYEPLPEEVNSNTNEADHKGMTPGQIDEAPMASDQEACEDGEAHGGSYTADDGAEVELGGPALFVRAHPAPLPDPLLFGSGADDQVAIGWLQPYGHHRKPGISATDSANVSLYRKWGQALAGNGPDVPRLGLVLFPTLRNAYGGSLAAAAGFLQEVRPVLWGLAACNMIVDEALGRLLAEAIAGSPGLRFLALSFYLGATEEGLGLVCPAVGRSGSLRVVAIPGRFIGPQGAEALATSLAENSSVLYLLMGPMAPIVNAKESVESGDEILGEPLGLPTDKGCMSLARMMIHNSTIRVMDLSGCGAGDETCRVLAEALKTNRTLAELFLCDNAIGRSPLLLLPARAIRFVPIRSEARVAPVSRE